MRPTVYSCEPLGGWSATRPLLDYGRVARDPIRMPEESPKCRFFRGRVCAPSAKVTRTVAQPWDPHASLGARE